MFLCQKCYWTGGYGNGNECPNHKKDYLIEYNEVSLWKRFKGGQTLTSDERYALDDALLEYVL